jgi:hypothetical protein
LQHAVAVYHWRRPDAWLIDSGPIGDRFPWTRTSDWHPGIDPAHYLVIVSCGLLVTIFPISVGGWGIRESALVIGFGLMSVEPEKAFALSATFGVLAMLSAGGAALLGLTHFIQKPIDDLANAPTRKPIA